MISIYKILEKTCLTNFKLIIHKNRKSRQKISTYIIGVLYKRCMLINLLERITCIDEQKYKFMNTCRYERKDAL